jgi:hypothetical protein
MPHILDGRHQPAPRRLVNFDARIASAIGRSSDLQAMNNQTLYWPSLPNPGED